MSPKRSSASAPWSCPGLSLPTARCPGLSLHGPSPCCPPLSGKEAHLLPALPHFSSLPSAAPCAHMHSSFHFGMNPRESRASKVSTRGRSVWPCVCRTLLLGSRRSSCKNNCLVFICLWPPERSRPLEEGGKAGAASQQEEQRTAPGSLPLTACVSRRTRVPLA